MKNLFKLGALALVLSVSIVACDPAKDKKKEESVTITKTEIDTTKTDNPAVAPTAAKDSVVTSEAKKLRLKSSN